MCKIPLIFFLLSNLKIDIKNVPRNNKNVIKKSSLGFTLIEIILVIGILSVLLTITIIAINPQRQFASAHNTKRQNDVKTILDAIAQFQTENHGALPGSLTSASCPTNSPCSIQGNGALGSIDLCPLLVSDYISALPEDPSIDTGSAISVCNNSYISGYEVSVSSQNNRVTISAPNAELGESISISR